MPQNVMFKFYACFRGWLTQAILLINIFSNIAKKIQSLKSSFSQITEHCSYSLKCLYLGDGVHQLISILTICKYRMAQLRSDGMDQRGGTQVGISDDKVPGVRRALVRQFHLLLDPRGQSEHKRALPLHLVACNAPFTPGSVPDKNMPLTH